MPTFFHVAIIATEGIAISGLTIHGILGIPNTISNLLSNPESNEYNCCHKIVTTTPETTTGRKYIVLKTERSFIFEFRRCYEQSCRKQWCWFKKWPSCCHITNLKIHDSLYCFNLIIFVSTYHKIFIICKKNYRTLWSKTRSNWQ